MELNFEGLEMQKVKISTNSSKSRWKKWGHLPNYHVYSPSYGHYNVKNGSFFVFSADARKNQSQFEQNI